MDPTKLLEADHREVEALFERIEQAEGADRTPLIDELASSLQAHMELEEQVLYPAMAPITGQEPIEEGNNEHEVARTSLQELLGLAPDQPGFGAALEALKAAITHHVEEEEGDVFPELRSEDGFLEGIVAPFAKLRRELGLPMDAATLADASTKDELLAEAQAAGVEVTTSMTKDELADAIVATLPDAS